MTTEVERCRRLAEQIADGTAPLPPDASTGALELALFRVARLLPQLRGRPHAGLLCQPRALFQWGHLDVVEKLGEGSVGEVFRAYDPLLDRQVALKLCRLDSYQIETSEWVAEARRLARVRHPNVLTVHGVDVHSGRAGIWLELVEGSSIEAWLDASGPLAPAQISAAALDFCRGLGAIHRAGLLHRDLKPANLLRDRDGHVRIADFGAAGEIGPASCARVRPTTPATCAPEVLAGGSASVASDLYSVGAVLCWLALGRLPFDSSQFAGLLDEQQAGLSAQRRQQLTAAMGADYADLVALLLDPDPRRRPASAQVVERRLAQLLSAWTAPASGLPALGSASPVPAAPTLIGREAALESLRLTLARSCSGNAGVAVIRGEPGAGKSTLIDAFAAELELRGVRVARVRLSDGSPSRRPPAWLTPGDREAPIEVDRPATAGSSSAVWVVCIDDWHCAERDERDAWRECAESLRDRPMLWVVSVDEGAARGIEQNERIVFPAHTRIVLKPFSLDECQQLLALWLDPGDDGQPLPAALPQLLFELSGGNPFYLRELVERIKRERLLQPLASADLGCWRQRLSEMPATLRVAAARRLAALSSGARAVLETAAVIGREFELAALQATMKPASSATPALLDELLRFGWLARQGRNRYQFRHEILRLAVYESLDEQHSRGVHQRCIDWLQHRRDPASRQALSHHAELNGEFDLALRSGLAAVTLARPESAASPEQFERLRRLLEQGAEATPRARAAIYLGLLRGLRDAGRLREAQALAIQQEPRLRLKAGSSAGLQWRIETARTVMALGNYRDALDGLEPALQAAEANPRMGPEWRHRGQLLAVRAQISLGAYRGAQQSLELTLSRDAMLPALRGEMQELLGWALALQGELRAADRALESAWILSTEASATQRATLLRRRHWVKLGRGRYQQAFALALEAHSLFRQAANPVGCAKLSMSLGQTRLCQGLPEEAMGFLHRTLVQLENLGDAHCEAEVHWLLGRALTEIDQLPAAERHLRTALNLIQPIGDRDDEFRFLIDLARLRIRQGQCQAAVAAASQAQRIASELGNHEGQMFAQVEHAAALLQGAAAAPARALAEQAVAALKSSESGEVWRAEWVLACCCDAVGESAPGARALDAARRQIETTIGELPVLDALRAASIRRTRRAILSPFPCRPGLAQPA